MVEVTNVEKQALKRTQKINQGKAPTFSFRRLLRFLATAEEELAFVELFWNMRTATSSCEKEITCLARPVYLLWNIRNTVRKKRPVTTKSKTCSSASSAHRIHCATRAATAKTNKRKKERKKESTVRRNDIDVSININIPSRVPPSKQRELASKARRKKSRQGEKTRKRSVKLVPCFICVFVGCLTVRSSPASAGTARD